MTTWKWNLDCTVRQYGKTYSLNLLSANYLVSLVLRRMSSSPQIEASENAVFNQPTSPEGEGEESQPIGLYARETTGSKDAPEGHEEAATTGDEYIYLQRGFTSEIFKISVHNLPPYARFTVGGGLLLE